MSYTSMTNSVNQAIINAPRSVTDLSSLSQSDRLRQLVASARKNPVEYDYAKIADKLPDSISNFAQYSKQFPSYVDLVLGWKNSDTSASSIISNANNSSKLVLKSPLSKLGNGQVGAISGQLGSFLSGAAGGLAVAAWIQGIRKITMPESALGKTIVGGLAAGGSYMAVVGAGAAANGLLAVPAIATNAALGGALNSFQAAAFGPIGLAVACGLAATMICVAIVRTGQQNKVKDTLGVDLINKGAEYLSNPSRVDRAEYSALFEVNKKFESGLKDFEKVSGIKMVNDSPDLAPAEKKKGQSDKDWEKQEADKREKKYAPFKYPALTAAEKSQCADETDEKIMQVSKRMQIRAAIAQQEGIPQAGSSVDDLKEMAMLLAKKSPNEAQQIFETFEKTIKELTQGVIGTGIGKDKGSMKEEQSSRNQNNWLEASLTEMAHKMGAKYQPKWNTADKHLDKVKKKLTENGVSYQ